MKGPSSAKHFRKERNSLTIFPISYHEVAAVFRQLEGEYNDLVKTITKTVQKKHQTVLIERIQNGIYTGNIDTIGFLDTPENTVSFDVAGKASMVFEHMETLLEPIKQRLISEGISSELASKKLQRMVLYHLQKKGYDQYSALLNDPESHTMLRARQSALFAKHFAVKDIRSAEARGTLLQELALLFPALLKPLSVPYETNISFKETVSDLPHEMEVLRLKLNPENVAEPPNVMMEDLFEMNGIHASDRYGILLSRPITEIYASISTVFAILKRESEQKGKLSKSAIDTILKDVRKEMLTVAFLRVGDKKENQVDPFIRPGHAFGSLSDLDLDQCEITFDPPGFRLRTENTARTEPLQNEKETYVHTGCLAAFHPSAKEKKESFLEQVIDEAIAVFRENIIL